MGLWVFYIFMVLLCLLLFLDYYEFKKFNYVFNCFNFFWFLNIDNGSGFCVIYVFCNCNYVKGLCFKLEWVDIVVSSD